MGAFLVVTATGVPAIDAAAVAEARSLGALICNASQPGIGNIQFMATIRRGSLLIGFQTGGAAPVVTQALRTHLERLLPDDLGAVIDQLGALRRELREREPDSRKRVRRWQAAVEAGAIDAALSGAGPGAIAAARQMLLPD